MKNKITMAQNLNFSIVLFVRYIIYYLYVVKFSFFIYMFYYNNVFTQQNLEALIIYSASCCCSWSLFQFLQSDCSSSASILFLPWLERPWADPPRRRGVRGPCGETDSEKFPSDVSSSHWSWAIYKANLLASWIEETGNLLTWSLYFCIITNVLHQLLDMT